MANLPKASSPPLGQILTTFNASYSPTHSILLHWIFNLVVAANHLLRDLNPQPRGLVA